MPDQRGKHPNARAHQFKPGESGNPAGRPRSSAGATIREWINELADKTEAHVRAVIADTDSPAAKVIAARRVLNAMLDSSTWKVVKDKDSGEEELYRTGESPGPAMDFDRIMDRTEGKPAQSVDMTHEHTGSLTVHIE